MKYVKLSSALVALFFAVGCGSKTVDTTSGTSSKTTQQQPAETVEQESVETIIVPEPAEDVASNDMMNMNGTNYGPEGAFMPGPGSGYPSENDVVAGNNEETQEPSHDEMANHEDMSHDSESLSQNTQEAVDNSNEMSDITENVNGTSGENNAQENIDGNDEMAGEYEPLVLESLASVYFNFDRYNIRDDMKRYIRANADYIKAHDIHSVVLQGHTDEFGGDEYNTALGLKRAISVRDALVLQGLPRNMFSTISYGMHKPVCKEKTAECYAKNRRTDLVEKQ